MKRAEILKYLRLPLLLGVPTLAVLLALWLVQQHNVNSLKQQLDVLQQQIDTLPATVAPKDKLALQKDRLILEKDRINAQNAIYGTLVQALGGVFFVVTAYFTYRNLRATEANVRAAEEKQVTERFSKAIELLGNEKLEVRLGGIYALERIAKDSRKDHWTIIEVLTSFVREKSPLQLPKNIQQEPKKITVDVQAALTVIKRRDSSKDQERQYIDLSNTNLSRADLSGANLRGAYLIGANLSGTRLMEANLSGAYLIGANLSEAVLMKADLCGANLWQANLYEAIFDEANLNGAILMGADLVRADLCNADLSRANLSEANLREAQLSRANLREAQLSRANLREAFNLTQEQISEAITDKTTKLPDDLQSPQSEPPDSQKP